MHYLLLAYGAEDAWTDDERTACMVESLAACDRLAAQGKYLAASPLLPVSTASTTRVRDGRPLVTDGPFAETTEHLGGFFLLDLDDLDEAIRVAASLPPARKGTIEIRPVLELHGTPQPPPGATARLRHRRRARRRGRRNPPAPRGHRDVRARPRRRAGGRRRPVRRRRGAARQRVDRRHGCEPPCGPRRRRRGAAAVRPDHRP